MTPREAVARALDRVNVRAADARLGSHPPTIVQVPPPPRGAPVRGRDARREMWTADGSDWIAERRPARSGRPRAAIILLHGWLASHLQFTYYRWVSRPLLAHMDVWHPRLPEHGERTTRGAVSGQLCLSGDAELTFRQMRCAVAETRWLARALKERGHRVGLWGVSLGGWVAALAAGPEVCDALALWAPVLDPTIALHESALGSALARRLDSADAKAELERRFAELAPAADAWALPGNRVLVVGGEFDDISPPSVLRGVEARTGASVRVLPHGHISLLASRRARRETLAFLKSAIAVREHS